MANIAIITARGGSKRIPRKNIKEFCGKPIIAYSIKAALDSGIFDEVMVSTDDEEIAEISKEYGASVPFMRSAETASDYATTKDVLNEVIREYEKIGKVFDYMACIYPTAPFVTGEKLRKSLDRLIETDADCVLPVVGFSYPPQRCFIEMEDGSLEYQFPEYAMTRSQDLPTWYHDIGQYYFYNVIKYTKKNGILTKTVPLVVSELEVQDIDNETDWKLAEIKYKLMVGEL